MLFSTNAEPILMLQINRVKPFQLPSILQRVWPDRIDYMVGRLDGYHWVFGVNSGFVGSWTQSLSDRAIYRRRKTQLQTFRQPGTRNQRHGSLRWTGCSSHRAPASKSDVLYREWTAGNTGDAGDRRGGFDFAYRLPGLRDWLTLYADAFTDDEPNPWLAWNKAAFTSGLYLSHVPRIPNLDFRVEGIFTDLPGGQPTVQHGFFYSNSRFKSGYTNDGNLIGSWIGRQGQGAKHGQITG